MHACIRIVFRRVGLFVSGKHVPTPARNACLPEILTDPKGSNAATCVAPSVAFVVASSVRPPWTKSHRCLRRKANVFRSEAEEQMDKNAGWDEGTCAQCGACYVISIIRPVLCQCGAELCGYSFRCLFAHAKRCAAATNAQAAYE